MWPASLERVRDVLAADPGAAALGHAPVRARRAAHARRLGRLQGPARRRDGVVELGYALAPAFRGRGLATAAVAAMLREAFAGAAVRAVIAHTLAERNASGRVLEKAGFAFDGEVADEGGGTTWRYRVERSQANRPSTTASRP